MNSATPDRIGRYLLLECLGGGMSQVWRATDTTIGRTVAIKILTPEGCAIPETCERFLQEARMAGNISHENIVNIYDYGEADGRPFLVMEFLEGQDLRSLIRSQQTGDTTQKLRIALQIARALEYIHNRKIVHRDIKPDNVRIVGSGTVKLMDFGIAKAEGLARTQAGFVLGSPYYMAPEQIRGEVSPLVDAYAFGILLFELFSGVKPFKAESYEQIFHCTLNEPIDFTPMRLAQTPESIIRLAESSTAKDPAARPQSFSEVRSELERLLGIGGPPVVEVRSPLAPLPPLPDPHPRKRKWKIGTTKTPTWTWLVLGLAAAGLVALLAWLLVRPLKTKVPEQASSISPRGMILIPAGQFLSGEGRVPQTLPAFLIDKAEVSNADYLRFAKASGHFVPPALKTAPTGLPVTDISFDDAAAYARWAGKRLPSFLEWERAARGTDGRKYPWGNQAPFGPARIDMPGKGPEPVDTPGDLSPDGILNMGGNVSEWVDQTETPSPQAVAHFAGLDPPATASEHWSAMRGGSFMLPEEAAETWAYQSLPARFHSPAVGFRCAKSQ